MSRDPHTVTVDVAGQQVRLTHLDKVLYPAGGFTKGQVVDYYSRVAPVLLPHLRRRPVTLVRYPNGVDGKSFFAKNAPAGTPGWVRTATLPSPGSAKDRDTLDYVVVDDLPTLVWAANLAGLELHVPQWKVGPHGAAAEPDLLVLDLDPGPPATVVECAWVALLLRDALAADGLTPFAKTSGSKGLQLMVPVSSGDTHGYARTLAQRLAAAHPGLVVWKMTMADRTGKVLLDWSQNSAAKTTVAPYSLRARERPTVSTPLTWAEVEGCTAADDLVFTSDDVLARVAGGSDLLAGLDAARAPLP